MNYYFKKYKVKVFSLIVLSLIVVGCAFLIDGSTFVVENEAGEKVSYIEAGKVASFKFSGKLDGLNGDNESFIMAFLVPRSWNPRQNAIVSYVEDRYEPGENHPMTIIPENEEPLNSKGKTWAAALMSRFGVGNNVLNDMEWVTFKSKPYGHVDGTINFTVTIKCNVGNNNLKFKPSFFINHSSDGLGTNTEHFDVFNSNDCFEVVEGRGIVTDFCSTHYYQITPLMSLQDDFITFTFQGDVYTDNDLAKYDKVYWEAVAYTVEGNEYKVDEKSSKTLMKRETKLPRYNLTIWPVGFFNIPEGETISHIDYIFTNEDGTVSISQSDDDKDNNGEEVEDGAKEPFVFELQCE